MTDAALPLWSVHDVFVQANVVHGYRYLDVSGLVLNTLSDRYKSVNVVSPAGTSLSHPVDSTRDPFEIQFASERLWLHYVGIDAVQKIEGTAPEVLRSIAEKLEMKEFDRYGLRVSYFAATPSVLVAAEKVTRRLVAAPIADLVSNRRLDVRTNLEIPLLFRDMEVIFRFRWIVIRRPPVNPPDFSGDGLILDIDVGQRSDDALFRRHDFSSLMSRAVETHAELLAKYGQPLLQGVEP